MTKDEALKLALEALEEINKLSVGENAICLPAEIDTAMDACRKVLAQPEQEPVAYTTGHCENHKQKGGCQLHNLQCGWPDCDRKPITTPPQRKPLTDEEIDQICGDVGYGYISVARAIEAAHGIKE